jgi:predicted nucleic acid-binding protein
MTRAVTDANVIVKWYINEKDTDKALEMRNKYINGEIEILAPEILPFEVLNALRYADLFTPDELKKVVASLSAYGLRLYTLKGDLAKKTIYDASYIALALVTDSKFYTADERLIDSIGDEDLFNISEFS